MNTRYIVKQCHGIKGGEIPDWKSLGLACDLEGFLSFISFSPLSSLPEFLLLSISQHVLRAHTQGFTYKHVSPDPPPPHTHSLLLSSEWS